MSDGSAVEPIDAAVVDTDVLSFWQRNDTRGAAYSQALAGRTLFISFQTVAEQLRWAEERHWSPRRQRELEQYLRQFVVVPYSLDLAREWAHLMASMSRVGQRMSPGDAWIAATALTIGAPLATHDRADFEHVPGLHVITFAPESRT